MGQTGNGRDGCVREMKERSGEAGRWEWRPRGLLFVGVWKCKWKRLWLSGSVFWQGNGGRRLA